MRCWPVMAIACAGLCTHGWILLTDYRLWDGWEYALWLSNQSQTQFLSRLFDEIGRPLDGLFYFALRHLQYPHIVAKYIGVGAWVLQAVLMYECLRRTWFLGSSLALSVSLLVATCPSFRPLGELSLWMNTCAATLFWMGAYLMVKTSEVQLHHLRGCLRVVGIVCIFISFNLNSVLVFFYGLTAVLVLQLILRNGLRSGWQQSVALMRQYPDLLVLPVIFWCWKSWFTPAYGPYANYNRPTLDVLMWARGYLVLVTNFLVPFLAEMLARPGVIAVVVAAAICFGFWFRARPELSGPFAVPNLPVGPLFMATAGLVLLLAASFPYICVGQVLADDPWLARNNILTPLPIALLVVSIAIWMTAKVVPTRPTAWFGVCLAICAVWGISSIVGYMRLQAFGVKQLAIRGHLRELIEELNPAVIQFRDYAAIRGGIAYYPPVIWTALAACDDQMPRTLVFDSRIAVADQQIRSEDGSVQIAFGTLQLGAADVQRAIVDTTMAYALQQIPHHGRQFLLAALPTAKLGSPERLALDYLRRRWEGDADVEEWVKQTVDVKAIELEPIRAEPAAR